MKVGLQFVYQAHEGISDAEMFRRETQLAIEAEQMGFDFVGVVEHHFTDYAMCPENTQVLAYIAAKTSKLQLMPAAFILPWNDPLRVAEKAVQLDILSEGRVIIGFGRGLAKIEYDILKIDMAESRDRFDEAAAMILEAVETGFIEGKGPYYPQPRAELRPRPEKSFKGRSYMVGMSPSSIDVAAKLGLGTLKFSQGLWENMMPEVNQYRASFEQHHGTAAPPIIIADMVACFNDSQKSKDYARQYQGAYFRSVLDHYEMLGDHFQNIPSYANYANAAHAMQTEGVDKAFEDYLTSNLHGTPEEIVEKIQKRAEIVGDHDLSVNFTYGSMPYEDVWEQAKTFADKVLPHIK